MRVSHKPRGAVHPFAYIFICGNVYVRSYVLFCGPLCLYKWYLYNSKLKDKDRARGRNVRCLNGSVHSYYSPNKLYTIETLNSCSLCLSRMHLYNSFPLVGARVCISAFSYVMC